MGVRTRLHSEHQRIALAIHDGGCTAVGCDRPPRWRQAHHMIPWSRGGPTSVANGRLLCSYHRHRAHDTAYAMTNQADRKVSFHRRM